MPDDGYHKSRRTLLKAVGAGGIAALSGCLGDDDDTEYVRPIDIESFPPEEYESSVNVWNWYTDWVDWHTEPFQESYEGIDQVNAQAYSGPSEWYSRLEAGNDEIDTISATNEWVVRAMNNDYLEPLPVDRMEAWDVLTPLAREDAEEHYSMDGEIYAIPEAVVMQPSLTYNEEYFDSPPDSWSILWDEELEGMMFMEDWAEVSCRIAALYTGQDPNDPDDFDEIEEVLVQQRDLNVTYWNEFSSAMEMFVNEEIVVGPLRDGRTWMARFLNDAPINYAVPDEGMMYTYDNFVIPEGAPNPRAAAAWIDHGGQVSSRVQLFAEMGYVPPIENLETELTEVVSEEEAAFADWLDPDELIFIEPLEEEVLDRYDEIWTTVVAG
ncbi:ABC transporter substrate-binding protein [Natrononativus amylolyticus]|uniref:ABC transporter substrate-binding protein n=1 Tax=Natrononativus amylolyticus TaxID=2963434 RepID=UPI0020CF9623|nr:PotD/PotF family extracellular solute-binding protein [Natrononativus amylolyticus]